MVRSRLGTLPATATIGVVQQTGWLRRKVVDREVGYLDWAIDGVPLRRLLAWPNGAVAHEVTPVGNDRAFPADRISYLRALLGGGSEPAVMPDGRVPLLVCGVDFDLSCRALTAELVREADAVIWRDIAWQADDDPLDLAGQEMPVISVVFDREQYEDVIRELLERESDPVRAPARGRTRPAPPGPAADR